MQLHNLFRRHVAAQGIFLRNHGKLAFNVAVAARETFAIHDNLTFIGDQERCKQLDHSRLTRAVGAEQPEELSRLNF